MMNNENSNLRSWDEVQNEIFTTEEIAESTLRVEIIVALIKARQEQGISQKKLEELSGVKQPIIARMEKGYTSPQLETVLKVLEPLELMLKINSKAPLLGASQPVKKGNNNQQITTQKLSIKPNGGLLCCFSL